MNKKTTLGLFLFLSHQVRVNVLGEMLGPCRCGVQPLSCIHPGLYYIGSCLGETEFYTQFFTRVWLLMKNVALQETQMRLYQYSHLRRGAGRMLPPSFVRSVLTVGLGFIPILEPLSLALLSPSLHFLPLCFSYTQVSLL